MKKLTKLEKFGMAAAIVVIGTYFYMGKVYDPQAASLKKTVTSLNKIIQEINAMEEVKSERSIRKTVEKREAELAVLKENQGGSVRQTGDESEITTLMTDINQRIEGSGLKALAILPMGEAETGLLGGFKKYSLQISGRYYPFLGFIKGLESMEDAVVIEHITMEKMDDGLPLRISLDLMI
ncbi:type 4a pilus biogenesis protein PilO [Desulfoluna sp.]|uniref:type 4a pilus biogenesis protein PilO n=1 Tax=Desulfoluna sp. TaxID=2045199 RepID=UPI00262E92F3|nr:type 4a pilus biogenesis protein PilO [Desulfoluna sp.]